MTIFQWNDSLNVGIAEVDAQHMKLVDMVNDLDEAFAKGNELSLIQDLYDRLGEYTLYHFGTEERLMAEGRIDPEHVRKHKAMHANFVQMVTDLKGTLDAVDPKVVGALLEFLLKWLVHHTQGLDREMARLLSGVPGAAPRDDHEVLLQRSLDQEKALLNIIAALRESEDRYRSLVSELEKRVEQRTAELSDTNERLIAEVVERCHAEQALRDEQEAQRLLIKQLEDAHNQLLQSEKMASIGQLAAGVAHEINNPIGFVNSNLGTLKRYVNQLLRLIDAFEQGDAAAVKEDINLPYLRQDILNLLVESRDGVDRVKRIVQDLKDFSHVDETEWNWANLNKGLDSTLNVVSNEIKYKAEVIKKYGDIPEIYCLPRQLNQVFMNLLVNAAHAIDGRGTITVRTGSEAGQVWVEIADSGKGIPPENLTRIFDPFFTTKPVGKGTGLGLSLSYGIVDKHHGDIVVESEVGKGTTFRIRLPVEQPGA
ncbi:MAG: bacteriohemerythrin [Sulfuricella sp.]|nr:bacteriohemerythrin [Sulfuricella sp.]